MKLAGKNIVITGASQGLGAAIARQAVAEGASVLLVARTATDLDATREAIAQNAPNDCKVLSHVADVSNTDSVSGIFGAAVDQLGAIHGLVNNAGVYGPMGLTEEVDWQQWVDALSVNLLGTVYACREVIKHLRRVGRGKIVNLSGGGATGPLPRFTAYGCSKVAVVRFTETLAGELADSGIDVNAIAPGALNTRLHDQVLDAGPEVVGEGFYAKAEKQKESGGASLERAAALAVYLLSEQSDGITGKLISAVWDPWEELAQHRGDLAGDIYTLRRIVPSDRGKGWGDT